MQSVFDAQHFWLPGGCEGKKKPPAVEVRAAGLPKKYAQKILMMMAEPTGFEPATSDVTGRRSNQLNYDSAFQIPVFREFKPASPRYLIGTVGLEPTTSTL
jgi:hypothetical protein